MCGNKMIVVPNEVDRYIFELYSKIPNLSYPEATRILENTILKNVDQRKTKYGIPISENDYCDFIYGEMEDAIETEKRLKELYC